MKNGLTDISGMKIGHWTDMEAKTGCTVVLCPPGGAVGGVDVRGSAPGTRETDLLRGYNAVERIHAVLLTGGSAYGLDAAAGVMHVLERRGIGIDVGVGVVPIVPAAVLFDLAVGSASVRPGREAGISACEAASADAPLFGAVGAGTGATIGKAFGMEHAHGSGIGSHCIALGDGVLVAALAAVNALGDVYDHRTGALLAAARKADAFMPCHGMLQGANAVPVGTNTTIGVVATNATLTREQANKLASMAHDGLAMSIRPVHTSMDGDTVFGLSTLEKQMESPLAVFAAAAEAMALAIESVFI